MFFEEKGYQTHSQHMDWITSPSYCVQRRLAEDSESVWWVVYLCMAARKRDKRRSKLMLHCWLAIVLREGNTIHCAVSNVLKIFKITSFEDMNFKDGTMVEQKDRSSDRLIYTCNPSGSSNADKSLKTIDHSGSIVYLSFSLFLIFKWSIAQIQLPHLSHSLLFDFLWLSPTWLPTCNIRDVAHQCSSPQADGWEGNPRSIYPIELPDRN